MTTPSDEVVDLETTAREYGEQQLKDFKADTNYSEKWAVDEIAHDAFLAGAAHMQKRIEELEAEIKLGYRVNSQLNVAMESLLSDLTKEREISKMLAEALNIYSITSDALPEFGDVARQALAEVAKLRGK